MKRTRRVLSSDFDYSSSRRSSLLLRFGGQSGVYSVAAFVTRLGNLALLSIYWNRLRPEDFGLLAIAEIVSIGLVGIMTLCLESVISRFYHEWSEEERARCLGALWLTGIGSSTAILAAACALGALLWDRLGFPVEFNPYILLAASVAFVRSFSNIPFALLRIRERLYLFSVMQFLSLVLSGGLSVYLLLFAGYGVAGILAGNLAGYAITAVFWSFYMARQIRPTLKAEYLRPYLAFALPLVPTAVVSIATSLCDRVFLGRFASLGEVGLYAVSTRFSAIVREVDQPLKNAWFPFAVRLAIQRADGLSTIANLASYYVAALLTTALAVALLSHELISWLSPAEYSAAYAYVPVLVLAAYLDVFDVLAGVGLAVRKATHRGLLLAVFEGMLALTVLGVLTRAYGVWGTVVGLLLSRFIAVLVRFLAAQHVWPVPYEYGKWLGMTCLGAVTFVLGSHIEAANEALVVALKLGAISTFIVAIAWFFLDLKRAFRMLWDASPRLRGSSQ